MVETLAQDWSSLDREMQYECAGGHQRSYAQLGWTCGKDGLQRNLCEGSEMSRPPMVEMETDKLERGGERQMVWSTPTTVQNLQVGGHGCWGGLQICWERGWFVGNGSRQHGLVASCSKPWKLEAIFEMWKEPCIDGPGCLGDPSASGMTGTNAVVAWLTEKRVVRERFSEHLLPLSRYQANWDIAVMLSWYSAGYGWLGSYGSWYGRRRGRWNGKSEIRSDVDWFCQTCGTKVLSWNVAGVVFVSLISSVEDLEPGLTDFFHVGELILGPQLTDDLNDFMSASAAHMTVTNTWMNTHTHTELELPADPVFWLNTVLCDGNGKTSVQKLWVIEQMDCGRAGWIQDDAEAGMQAGESLVDMMAPMTFKVALMAASWLAHIEASMVAPMASLVALMASVVSPMASMASMVAPMALVVALMASLASMVETLDWWKRMTAESSSDGERVDGWTHKIREGRVDGLTKRTVHERADGLTHKIREEPTVGWTLFCRCGSGCHLGQNEKGSIIGGLGGIDGVDSLDSGIDGDFDDGYDGGMASMASSMATNGFESKKRQLQKAIERVSKKNARMRDDAMDQQWRWW